MAPLSRRGLLAGMPLLPLGARIAPFGPRPAPGANAAASSSPAPQSNATRESPEIVVLGTAQDAGVPQVNCFKDHCARVRAGQSPAPGVACLGLRDGAGHHWLFDATPDFTAQVGTLLAPAGAAPPELRDRTVPLQEQLHGIFLTHAHIGHYLGLAQLGKEAAAPRELPVWCTAPMAAFLTANAPWEMLVRNGYVTLRVLTPGEPVALGAGLEATPFHVVHRPEYADTVGYVVRGPRAALMYVPDADAWDGWQVPFEEILASVDVALLDGSFYSLDELGHRVQADVPHPPVSVTVPRLARMPGRPRVWFTHLNHTNPLWDPDSPLRAQLPEGFDVATTGQAFPI